ncbi:PAS domain S-box protein, partial [Methanoregula sp.]|uniref:PAS domain S-box protein n=1 Tax=Methanoregula sp. TaxID=2052170 RepID=UPI003BAE2C6D
MSEGSLDAVVVDYRVGSYVLAENNIQNIKVTGDPIDSSNSSIAVKKGNTKLLNEINNALQIIKSDGTYQKIIDKWQPTEAIFETQQQITDGNYRITIFILLLLILIAVIWTLTIRKDLTKRKAAEEKLREQYSTLHGIINSANALIFSVDRDYRYTSFNQGHAAAMKAIYGAEIEPGHSLLDYMTAAEDRETAKRNLDRALAGEVLVEESYSGEERRSRKYFQVSHSPIRSDGEIIGVAILARDITDRKLAEDEMEQRVAERTSDLSLAQEELRQINDALLANEHQLMRKNEDLTALNEELTTIQQDLRVSEERYRNLFETMAEGFAIDEIILDDKGKPVDLRYLSVNPAFELQTGLKAGKVLGRTTRELFPNAEPVWFDRYGEVVLTGKPAHFEEKFGPLGRWYDVMAYKTGKMQFAVIFVDITERKQIEEKLRTTLQRFYQILSNMQYGILLVTNEGRVEFANQGICDMFGLNDSPADLPGLSEKEMIDKIRYSYRDPDGAVARIREIVRLGGSVFGEDVGMQSKRVFLRDFVPIYLGGKLFGRLWIHRDITERKRAEGALRESENQLKTDLEAMKMLQNLGMLYIHEGNLEPILTEVVDAAIAITGADFGNIQLIDPELSELRIAAQRGFPDWWLNYWNSVSRGKGTCGTALARGERVIVEDIEQSPIFIGTPALDIQLRAGVRAVQSTPLMSREGKSLGMFSTHFKAPHRPDDRQLRLLDLLARQAADIIERAQSEEAFLKKNADLNAAYEEITSKEEELRQNIEELSLREKELIKSEADLKEALAEKEILLSEVHHRVKNNLTAFISLLSLDGTYEDTDGGRALRKDLQNRARSMALIHETLYRTGKFSKVDMEVYLTTLIDQIAGSYGESAKVRT